MTAYVLDPWLPLVKKITLSDTPVSSQIVSHNREISTQQIGPKSWSITLMIETPPLSYPDYRAMVSQLRQINNTKPFSFSLINAPANLQDTTVFYAGNCTDLQLSAARVAAQTTSALNYLNLVNLPPLTLIFRPGDYIQIGQAVRTVVDNAQSDSEGDVTVTLSEVLTAYPATGSSILWGNNIVWSNCYFTPNGYPTVGIDSKYGHNSINISNEQITFIQSFQ